jgi:hypothetical protein
MKKVVGTILLPTITSLQIIPFASVGSPAKPLRLRFVHTFDMAELHEQRQRQDVDACTSINEHVSDQHSIQVSPDEERLHVRTRIFRLLERDTLRTELQLRDVFRWCTEFCRDHEDHVDIHRD